MTTKSTQRRSYFTQEARLNLREDEQRWCRCVLHVASKQTPHCLEDVNRNARKVFEGQPCHNPYPVCSVTVGTSSRQCGRSYDFKNIPDNELKAYARMKHITIPRPYTRTEMLNAIKRWKQQEGFDRKNKGTRVHPPPF
jgi:hypothetical protein